MFKGIGKQVVVIKNPESEIFEEAIFIIKDSVINTEPDLLHECERILSCGNKCGSLSKKTNKIKYKGIIIGSSLSTALLIIVLILIKIL